MRPGQRDHRSERRFVAAVSLASAESGIRRIAAAFLLYHIWPSPLGVAASFGLPSLGELLLAPASGVIADRMRRPIVAATGYALGAVAAAGVVGVAVTEGPALMRVALLYALLWLLSASSSTFVGPALNSLAADLFAGDGLVRFQARKTAWSYAAWFAGALGAGLILRAGQILYGLVLMIALLCAAAALIHGLPDHARGDRAHGPSIRTGLRNALSFMRTHAFVRSFLQLVAVSNFPHNILLALPFFLALGARGGPTGFSVMETGIAIGTLLGSALVARWHRSYSLRLTLFSAFFVEGAICLALWIGADGSVLAATLLMALYGATDALFTPSFARLTQATPPTLRGQVHGLFNGAVTLVNPLAALAAGALLTRLSVPDLLLALSIAFFLISAWITKMRGLRPDALGDFRNPRTPTL